METCHEALDRVDFQYFKILTSCVANTVLERPSVYNFIPLLSWLLLGSLPLMCYIFDVDLTKIRTIFLSRQEYWMMIIMGWELKGTSESIELNFFFLQMRKQMYRRSNVLPRGPQLACTWYGVCTLRPVFHPQIQGAFQAPYISKCKGFQEKVQLATKIKRSKNFIGNIILNHVKHLALYSGPSEKGDRIQFTN